MAKLHSSREDIQKTREQMVIASNQMRLNLLNIARDVDDKATKTRVINAATMVRAIRWTVVDNRHLNPEPVSRHYMALAKCVHRLAEAVQSGHEKTASTQLTRIEAALRSATATLEVQVRRLRDAQAALGIDSKKNGGGR